MPKPILFQAPDPLPGLSLEVISITPRIAEDWLSKNTHNRNVRPAMVDAYARDMEAGKWTLNGEAIKFAKGGVLLDGQHRLHAVIKSNTTIKALVVRGVDPDVQDTMDTGAVRKYGDQLRLSGHRNASTLASVARRVVLWESGQRTNTGKIKATHSEMAEALERYPGIAESADFADQVRRLSGLPASIVGLAHFLFGQIDYEQAVWFLSRVADGIGLPAGHPVLAFRDRVRKERDRGGRIHETMLLALLINAWNAYRAGETRTRLNLPKGGLNPASFPEPK
jgi:hypothetical protein